MKELAETESLAELKKNHPILILQFGDEHCGPCHAIRYKIDQWIEKHPEAEARYISISDHVKLCAQMGIMSVPVVIVYMDRKETIREMGYFSLDDILNRIERYMKMMI